MKGSVIVISGIDTGIGKTFVTGLLGRALLLQGRNVITQKIVQTGCEGVSEDILEHRRLMGVELQDADREGLTCPYLFRYPASPHLAARMEGREIDPLHIRRATLALQKRYELVLLEGVGGLLVPLAPELLFADYIRDSGYGLLLVTSPRLGSINHTLLSIEACVKRGITIRGMIYNSFQSVDKLIADDSRDVIQHSMKKAGCSAPLINLRDGVLDSDALQRLSL
ncbi:MAG: ATP-dependent dethiobiotin synthetase BioD [Chlorobium sp.]|jgi:dethiobiotin synthetase|nr:ATP-dependent dethiobiotin synthetase BioD [Chlorobium sp.]